MNKRIGQFPFLELLPHSIASDKTIAAAASSLDAPLQATTFGIPNLLLWSRLEQKTEWLAKPLQRLVAASGLPSPLSTEALELLAWQFHVDFREVAKTDEQLAAMILSSIPWHRIKGTPASIKNALALFGYEGIEIEEHAPDMPWASYQLGLPEITELADLSAIYSICREMQPVRCRLWRVYNDAWDQRPGIFDYGNPERYGWDNFWWDYYSGVELPEVSGDGLIVSFGQVRRVQSEPWQKKPDNSAFIQNQLIASLIAYEDHFIWDVSRWDDVFVRNHGFVTGEVVSLQVGELQFISDDWQNGEWNDKPWGEGFRYDRVLPPFTIFCTFQPKSQLVHDDDSDKLNGWQGYDDLNSCHDVPMAQISDAAPAWDGFVWDSDTRQTQTLPILEQFEENQPVLAQKLNARCNSAAMVSNRLCSISGNSRLKSKPELAMQSVFSTGAGQVVWQSDCWNEDTWDEREWGDTPNLEPKREPCAFGVGEVAETWSGNWNENTWDQTGE